MNKGRDMEYELLAIDMDGTTLNSQVEVSEENQEAIRRAIDAGMIVVPASGRAFGFLPEVIRTFPGIHYAITSNGSSIVDVTTRKPYLVIPIPEDKAEAAFDILDQLDCFTEIYDKGDAIVSASSMERLDDFLPEVYHESFRQHEVVLPDDEFEALKKSDTIEKLNIFFAHEDDRQWAAKKLREEGLGMVLSAEGGIEVMNIECSKGEALRELCEKLDLDLSQVVAMGDSRNDIEMVQAAGRGVAVANALDDLKAVADEITVSNDENAVALIIDEILDGEESPMPKTA